MHILIIEDEPLIALDIQSIFEDQGARSFAIADTESEAIAMAKSHRPDLITSDVRLRSGTGPHAVSEIQDAVGPVPVIYITATPEACAGCPSAAILGKPLNQTTVVSAFKALTR